MKTQKTHSVKSILFDFDGTLCDSQPAFTKWHTLARQHLAKVLNTGYEIADSIFSKLWREGNQYYHVNPNKLIEHTTKGLKTGYPQLAVNDVKDLKELLLSVYEEPVCLYQDAEEVICKLKSYKIKIGIVTHAPNQWTNLKMKWTKINKFLINKHPYVVSMDGPKNGSSWITAADHYGIKRLDTWVVGDNLTADSNAAASAGFAKSYWLRRPNEKVWTIIRDGIKEEGVITIESLHEIVTHIENHL